MHARPATFLRPEILRARICRAALLLPRCACLECITARGETPALRVLLSVERSVERRNGGRARAYGRLENLCKGPTGRRWKEQEDKRPRRARAIRESRRGNCFPIGRDAILFPCFVVSLPSLPSPLPPPKLDCWTHTRDPFVTRDLVRVSICPCFSKALVYWLLLPWLLPDAARIWRR